MKKTNLYAGFCLLFMLLLFTRAAQAQHGKSKAPSATPAPAPYDAAEEKAREEMRQRFPVDYVPDPLDILGHSKNAEIPQFAIVEYRLKYSEYDKRYTAEPDQITLRTNGEYITIVDVYDGYGGQLPLGLSFPLTGKKAEATAGKNVLQKTEDALLYQTNDYRMYLELPQKSMNKNISHISFVYTGEFKKYTPYYTPAPVAETPKAEITEEKKVDDYSYKKHFDLLLLYRFLGNYIDSNRAEIKTLGESVFYQTEARFPGTVENYVEVKNGKGELKYVFYRGSDKTAANSKYNEIAEITTKYMEENVVTTNEKYCDACTGLSYRVRLSNGNKPLSHWVQLVSKPQGIYEVQLIYPIPLDKYYLKTVTKPVAETPKAQVVNATTPNVTATKTTTGDNGYISKVVKDIDVAKAADKVVRQQAIQTATQEDFCTAVQKVIKQFPNDFETWKGLEEKDYWKFLNRSWYSTYMIKGSAYADITENIDRRLYAKANGKTVNKYEWRCVLYDGPGDIGKILSIYQGYVSKMNACTQSCCTFTSARKSSMELGTGGQTTTWKVSTVQPGSSEKYKDMNINIRFSLNAIADTWFIDISID